MRLGLSVEYEDGKSGSNPYICKEVLSIIKQYSDGRDGFIRYRVQVKLCWRNIDTQKFTENVGLYDFIFSCTAENLTQ